MPDHELARMFVALTLLVVVAHVFGYLFGRLRQPPVIGEIIGGLLFGPTVLGAIAPGATAALFPETGITSVVLAAMYQLGLLFLMFLAGSEVPPRPSRGEHRTVLAVAASGLILPFAVGLAVVRFVDLDAISGPRGSTVTSSLVFGIAIAVTSVPVISRIMLDLGILNTAFARLVLAVAVIEDLVLYCVLAVVLGLAQASDDQAYGLPALLRLDTVAVAAAYHIIVAVVFFAVFLTWGTRLFRRMVLSERNVLERRSPTAFRMAFLLGMVLICVVLGINPIFGALVAGYCAARGDSRPSPSWTTLRQFSLAFFVPVYFALVGVRLDLIHHFNALFFAWFFLLAYVVKGASVWLGARLARQPKRRSVDLAVALNARGGPGIVLATVTLAAGVINEGFFTSLILLSIITSQIAGVWLDVAFRPDRAPTSPAPAGAAPVDGSARGTSSDEPARSRPVDGAARSRPVDGVARSRPVDEPARQARP